MGFPPSKSSSAWGSQKLTEMEVHVIPELNAIDIIIKVAICPLRGSHRDCIVGPQIPCIEQSHKNVAMLSIKDIIPHVGKCSNNIT